MDLFSSCGMLTLEEMETRGNILKRHGIQQFINMYRRYKDTSRIRFLWGDEVEYLLLKFDVESRTVRVNLSASKLLKALLESKNKIADWKPEYCDFQLEGSPLEPYGNKLENFSSSEEHLLQRRRFVERLLGKGEAIASFSAFPRLGLIGFTFPNIPPTKATSVITGSMFFPDRALADNPRNRIGTWNVRHRRERRLAVNVSVFRDKNTDSPFFVEGLADFQDQDASKTAKENHVFMDATGFGAGLCCLQVTVQASGVGEARLMYDQLANLSPIMLAISAATPVLRGALTATDTRWQTIAGASDDRNLEEIGLKPLEHFPHIMKKSRYDTISCYLSQQGSQHSDLNPPFDSSLFKQLTDAGVDSLLATHVAHLFCRNPVATPCQALQTALQQNVNDSDTSLFELFLYATWPSVRFKPPLSSEPGKTAGWRVEFRPMEIQMTDFENAALSVFVILLIRVLLHFNLNLIIPLSNVDENFRRAHTADAVLKEKFLFRTNVSSSSAANVVEMTIDQIVNGCDAFPGFVPICYKYLKETDCDAKTSEAISRYLNFVAGRANGRFKTNARWIRDFIANHQEYERDSRVSETIQFDLIKKSIDLSHHKVHDDTLLPATACFPGQKEVEKLEQIKVQVKCW